MAEYMLDTDISSYIMKRSHERVLGRLQEVPIDAVCISIITKSELLVGVEVSPRREQDRAALDEMIGANDLFIAAHARSLKLTLVTNNTQEFGRVQELRIENWSE